MAVGPLIQLAGLNGDRIMSIETMEFDSVPANEDCQCVGPNYNPKLSKLHAVLYKRQIIQQFGSYNLAKAGIHILTKSQYGDYTVPIIVIKYNGEFEDTVSLAFKIDSEISPNWSDDSKNFLSYFASSLDDPDKLADILCQTANYSKTLEQVKMAITE